MLCELVHLDVMSKLGVVIGDVASEYKSSAVHTTLPQGMIIALNAKTDKRKASFAWRLDLAAPTWRAGTCFQKFLVATSTSGINVLARDYRSVDSCSVSEAMFFGICSCFSFSGSVVHGRRGVF